MLHDENYDKCKCYLEKALKIDPTFTPAIVATIEMYIIKDQLDVARTLFVSLRVHCNATAIYRIHYLINLPECYIVCI